MKYRSYFSGRVLDKELRTLFEEKGKLPDMSHFERRRHRRTVRLLLGFVVFFALLTGISWSGFFLFGPRGSGGEASIEFSGPEIVVAGIPVDLKIHYKNLDRDPLAFANFSLRVPEHLSVEKLRPTPVSDRLRWEFGTLDPHYSGEIELTVIPYGVQEEQVEISGILSYKPANFNAEFQTSATHTFTIRATPLQITLDGPQKSSPGEPAELTFKIRNHTDETFEKLHAKLISPATFLSSTSKDNSPTATVALDSLAPGSETEIAFEGTFLSSAEGVQEFKLRLEVERQNKFFPVGELRHEIELAASPLQITTLINETPDLNWIRLNQPLNLRVSLKNNSGSTLPDGQVRLIIAGDIIDWTKVRAEAGNVDQNTQTITFPKPGSLTLAPGATDEFKALLPLKLQPNRTASPFVIISTELNYGLTKIKTPPQKLTVASDLTVSGEARYFGGDGNPIGSGPLPPKVGEETKYVLRFRLKNTFHDLDRLIVSAKLPDAARFIRTNTIQAGRIQFEETTREVRWEIPRMPVTTPELTADFTVGVIPAAQDLGKLVSLLGVTRVEAVDSISQVSFSADAPPVSSLLDADSFGSGKGVVQ